MKNIIKTTLISISICFCCSCQKYLDLKPDKSQVIPTTLDDCQALLNNAGVLYNAFPSSVELVSDDYYLSSNNWQMLTPDRRYPYIWQADSEINYGDWSGPYNRVLVANQVLEVLSTIKPSEQENMRWKGIKGAALLLRSFAFYGLAQIFAKPYDSRTADQDLGIPIRLTPSISEETKRGTLKQTYDRILQDLEEAVTLLPEVRPGNNASKSVAMPVKAAALAAAARLYLLTGDYPRAYEKADLCLKGYSQLMDYKDLNPNQSYPIPRFNSEVLYEIAASGFVPISRGLVSSDLYNSYKDGDLRKILFFRDMGNKAYQFKGTYIPGTVFAGLATDEMYLIRAECAARAGNPSKAIDDLNILLEKRWDKTFVPLKVTDAENTLRLVLAERRKELPFRGLRWTDIRRLNFDSRFKITLRRNLDGKEYLLPPNDIRFTLLIPKEIIERSNIQQNPR